MNRFLNSRAICSFFLLSVLSLSLGCGKGNDNPNPTPPPAPANPVPPPSPYNPYQPVPYANNTNCPLATVQVPGSPSSQYTPANGTLQPMYYGGNNGNSLTLSIASSQATSPFTASGPVNIVGSGSFNFPDLNSHPVPGAPSNLPTTFCISSNPISNYGQSGGVFNPYDQSIQLIMRGTVQYYVPAAIGPYGPTTNTTPQLVTDTVEVDIGYCGYPTRLVNGRIVGCVDVKVGNSQGTQFHYQSY